MGGEVLNFGNKDPEKQKMDVIARRLLSFSRHDTREPAEIERHVNFIQSSIRNFATKQLKEMLIEFDVASIVDADAADSIRAVIREINRRKEAGFS